jgi:hypothetical protein
MKFKLLSRVILKQDMPEENLFAGDVGIIVEHHPATSFYPEGYEVEFFTADGDTLTVVSVPETKLRTATGNDVFHVREKLKSSYNHA